MKHPVFRHNHTECIREWVRMLLHKPKAKMSSLSRMTDSDIELLATAIDKAGAEWMKNLIHTVMTDPEPTPEREWTPKNG